MAPEMLRLFLNQQSTGIVSATSSQYTEISEKVDVWALGCIINELYGGGLPFSDCISMSQLSSTVLGNKQIPAINHNRMPNEIAAIVNKCFIHEPLHRVSSNEVFSQLRLIH